MFLLYLGVLFLGIYVVFAVECRSLLWFLGPASPLTFWPDRQRRPLYRQLLFLHVILILALGAWVVHEEGVRLALAASVIPAYGCVLTLLTIRYGNKLCKKPLLWKWPVLFLAAVGLTAPGVDPWGLPLCLLPA